MTIKPSEISENSHIEEKLRLKKVKTKRIVCSIEYLVLGCNQYSNLRKDKLLRSDKEFKSSIKKVKDAAAIIDQWQGPNHPLTENIWQWIDVQKMLKPSILKIGCRAKPGRPSNLFTYCLIKMLGNIFFRKSIKPISKRYDFSLIKDVYSCITKSQLDDRAIRKILNRSYLRRKKYTN